MNYEEINKASKEFQSQFERLEECSSQHSKVTYDAFYNPDGCPLCIALDTINDKDSIEELQDQISDLEDTIEDYEDEKSSLENSIEDFQDEVKTLEDRVKELERENEELEEKLRDNIRLL